MTALTDTSAPETTPHLVLLHSLLTDSSAYRLLLDLLQPRIRATTVTLPGFPSGGPAVRGIEAVAAHVVQHLHNKGVRAPYHLLGNGYGGFVAIAIAQHHPGSVDRLVLMDTAAAFPENAKAAFHGMQNAVRRDGMRAAADTAMSRVFPGDCQASNPSIIEKCCEVFLSFDPEAFALNCQNLIDVDLRSGLSEIGNQTLVIVGSEDLATPPALARELAEVIRGAAYEELSGLGHAPHLQAPERIASLLLRFLAESTPAKI